MAVPRGEGMAVGQEWWGFRGDRWWWLEVGGALQVLRVGGAGVAGVGRFFWGVVPPGYLGVRVRLRSLSPALSLKGEGASPCREQAWFQQETTALAG